MNWKRFDPPRKLRIMAKVVKKGKKKKRGLRGGGAGSRSCRFRRCGRSSSRSLAAVCGYLPQPQRRPRDADDDLEGGEPREVQSEQAFEEAFYIFLETTPFPSVCGRVCPHPCEGECNRKEKEGAVGINSIERFIGDFGLEKGLKPKKLTDESRGPRRSPWLAPARAA